MVRVERGNVVLKVNDYEVQHYLNLGYNVTDETGKVLQAAIPTSVGELQLAYVNHKKLIAELEEEIARLKLAVKKSKKATTE